ncbi:MAG: hypothetical protein LBK00_11620 [Treponema sp.]|jgi:hypothetical protein|nr:hypothetical protein [Treponema sp.]
MKNVKRGLFVCWLLVVSVMLFAQDDFGFGFDDEDSGDTFSGSGAAFGSATPSAVNIGGHMGAALLGYTNDVSEGFSHVWRPGRIDGRLDFSASGSFGEAVINLKLNPAGFITQLQSDSDSKFNGFSNTVAFDEAYARAWFGDFELEAGMRKLTWGKADSLGPLDVINPFDYTELTSLNNVMNIKIANALIHGSYRFGQFSKIETLFVPVFEPWHFASKGRWAPAQVSDFNITQLAVATATGSSVTDPGKIAYLQTYTATALSSMVEQMTEAYPDTTTLDYAQMGLRFTTTIGSADIGAQYYYGWLGQPAVVMLDFATSIEQLGTALAAASDPIEIDQALQQIAPPKIVYNRYHQIGVDWAQVLLGFNVRAELAANITNDLKGDDGAVYNPHLAWSFGFDRDLVWGINLNLQANETIKLFYDKISGNPLLDTEAGTDMTSTRLTAALSKKILRDELELRAAALWGIEDSDFLIMPAIIWTKDAVQVEVSGGFFGGDEKGQLGQYHDNSFIKVGIKYSF